MKKKCSKTLLMNVSNDGLSKNISMNILNEKSNPYYLFGYLKFGILLFSFVNWIHDEALKRGINKIFFLARDGYIIKKAYEECINDKKIEIRYLEVSRRSLRVPILWKYCDYETVLTMVVNSKLVRLENIFDGLGLNINEYKDQILKAGLIKNSVFDKKTIRNDIRLQALYEEIKSDIVRNSKKEYISLLRYLKQKEVHGRFGVIDIGYGGSMQRYLQQILNCAGIFNDISGFYFGVADFYKKNIVNNINLELNGYLFDFQHNKNAIDKRSSFVGLFETLFLEQNGSVKKYIIDGDRVKVLRYKYEYEKNGKYSIDYFRVKKIQSGAIDFIRKVSKVKTIRLPQNPELSFRGIYEVGTNPTFNDIKLFGDMLFYDEGIVGKLAAPKSIFYYFFHPQILKRDFMQSRWKIGFMKRLLKLPLNYQRIYEIMKKIEDRGTVY